MFPASSVTRLISWGAVVAGCGMACGLAEQPVPPLTGPSAMAVSVTLAASPDTLMRDGVSSAEITMVVRDDAARPIANFPAAVDFEDGSADVDRGRLWARTIRTDTTGKARVLYTAPEARSWDRTDEVVGILFTPVGTNFGDALPRVVRIRLRAN